MFRVGVLIYVGKWEEEDGREVVGRLGRLEEVGEGDGGLCVEMYL